MNRGFAKVVAARRAKYRATDAQLAYLRSLLHKCFSRRITHGTRLDANHLDDHRLTKAQASEYIQQLKALLKEAEARS